MAVIGKVESVWRYPVKSMRGEELREAFIGFAGVYGDRLFAFRSAQRPSGFPYLTGREQTRMLLYIPRFRHPDKAAMPPNLAAAEGIAPGLSPTVADPGDLAVDVRDSRGSRPGGQRPDADPGIDRRARRWTYAHPAALGAGDDRLPSRLALLDPDGAAAGR